MDSFGDAVLLLGAVVGHTALMIRSHNWWYGTGLGKHVIDVLHLVHGLLTLAGAVVFVVVDPSSDDLSGRLLAGYSCICWAVAFLVVPMVTAARLLRRCPALMHETATSIDVESLVGKPLHGDGKHVALARFPFNEVCRVDLTVKTLSFPRMPREWEGLTILHLSDLHYGGTPAREYHERVLDLCAKWNADVIALTGDIVDSLAHHAWIEPLLGPLKAREARAAILGNHDQWYDPERVRSRLRDLGWRTPRNSWETIEVRGLPMTIVGHEGPWVTPAPDLSNCPRDVFRVCLSHTPDNIAWARRNDIDLMLAGHVHGGQVRLPVIGSLLLPSKYGRAYDCGTFLEGNTVLHVSRGLSGKHPLRWNCRPEATLLILTRSESTSRDNPVTSSTLPR